MTSRDFCFWLQGFFEVSKEKTLDKEKVETIKKHLALCFKHDIDPSMGDKKHQNILNEIHNQSNKDNPNLIMRC